jgi:hypothetical protein
MVPVRINSPPQFPFIPKARTKRNITITWPTFLRNSKGNVLERQVSSYIEREKLV